MFFKKSRIRCGFSLLKNGNILVYNYKNQQKKCLYFFEN